MLTTTAHLHAYNDFEGVPYGLESIQGEPLLGSCKVTITHARDQHAFAHVV